MIFANWGIALWNALFSLIVGSFLTSNSSSAVSVESLQYTETFKNVFPVFTSIAVSLFCLIFFVNFAKQNVNFKQNLTLETTAELGIKFIVGNFLITALPRILPLFIRMASALVGDGSGVVNAIKLEPLQADPNILTDIEGWWEIVIGNDTASNGVDTTIIGLVFFIVVLVCLFQIFIVVLGRLVDVFLLMITSPIAVSFVAGSGQLSQTSYSFLKTFLLKLFEVVMIYLAMGCAIFIGSKIGNVITEDLLGDMLRPNSVILVNYMCQIVLMATATKGASALMGKAFNL